MAYFAKDPPPAQVPGVQGVPGIRGGNPPLSKTNVLLWSFLGRVLAWVPLVLWGADSRHGSLFQLNSWGVMQSSIFLFFFFLTQVWVSFFGLCNCLFIFIDGLAQATPHSPSVPYLWQMTIVIACNKAKQKKRRTCLFLGITTDHRHPSWPARCRATQVAGGLCFEHALVAMKKADLKNI
jgi:hypothetical protein